jgi:hypothetical protein
MHLIVGGQDALAGFSAFQVRLASDLGTGLLRALQWTQYAKSTLCRQLCIHGQVECVVDLAGRGSRGRSCGFTD